MIMRIEDCELSDIYEFMEHGNVNNAPEHIVIYLNLLDKVRAMSQRIDQFGSKEAIVKHLIVAEGLSRYKANLIYNESIEYFYSEKYISKQAWRNIYADKADKALHFAMLQMKDEAGAMKVVQMAKEIAILRGINEPDKEELPADIFRAPFVIYSTDAEMLGLPKANRDKLAEIIDALPELSEKERIMIKREAQVLPIKVFQDEQEDARRS